MDDLNSWTSMATGQGRLVGLLVGSEARTRRTSLAVRPLVDSLSRGFAGYMDRFGISLEKRCAQRQSGRLLSTKPSYTPSYLT